MPTLVEELAARHLGGPLPPDFIEIMAPLDQAGDETAAFLRRMFEYMERARFRPRDWSLMAAQFTLVIPGTLPGRWDGMPPPATSPDRLRPLDDYLATNPWKRASDASAFIDIGCGFPPLTALDTASRFPHLEVIGIDPAFGHYLVYDRDGTHACFSRDGDLKFIWHSGATAAQLAAIAADLPAARARFSALLGRLRPALPAGDGPADVTVEECRIVRDPLAGYATSNLRFIGGGFGIGDVPAVDVVRAMNVLLYFDRTFQDEALRWAGRQLTNGGLFLHGVNSGGFRHERYAAWARRGPELRPIEFALAPIELRSLGPISWWSFHEDDREAFIHADVLAALADDATAREAFDDTLDAILADVGFCARREDGFLGGTGGRTAAESGAAIDAVEERLVAGGWIDRAAESITRTTGRRAWRNSIGHLAVDPLEWGWEPVALQ